MRRLFAKLLAGIALAHAGHFRLRFGDRSEEIAFWAYNLALCCLMFCIFSVSRVVGLSRLNYHISTDPNRAGGPDDLPCFLLGELSVMPPICPLLLPEVP